MHKCSYACVCTTDTDGDKLSQVQNDQDLTSVIINIIIQPSQPHMLKQDLAKSNQGCLLSEQWEKNENFYGMTV